MTNGKKPARRISNLRKRARSLLAKRAPSHETLNSLKDARRLVLELQMHQIELELQNEELQAAQEELARERKKYEELYLFAPLPYFTFDERDVIVDVNFAGAELLGARVKALLGHPLSPYLTPSALEAFIAARRAALETGRRQTCELELRTRKRIPFYVQAHTVALPAERGALQLWRTVMLDVTEHKLANEKLRESEERFRLLADSMSDVVFTLDSRQRHVGLYGDWVARAGLTPEFFLGKTAREILGEEAAAVHEEANRRALTGERVVYEWSAPASDGGTAYYQTSLSPIRNARGETTGLVGVGRDLTLFKRAQEALFQSEARYRSLFDNMTEGFALHELIFDENGEPCDYRFLDLNQAFETLTGLKRERTLGRTQREVLPQEDRFWFEAYKNVALGGAPIRAEHYSLALKRYYEVYAYSPAQNQFAVIFTDVTARKQAEERLERLNAELEWRVQERTRELLEAQERLTRQERLAALGQMAGSVGHELRNPLGVIANAVYYLNMAQEDADEKTKEYLHLIARQTEIASKTINDLLDFTCVKSLERSAVSLPALTRKAVENLPGCEAVQMRFDLPEDLPRVYADPQHIRQILVNLTLNACQAMGARGGEVIFSARADAAARTVSLSVRDTGSGIAADIMPKLFEPLFTTKARGIGLGLPVCRNLAEANGGSVEVESQPGIGSVFTLVLPMHAEGRSP